MEWRSLQILMEKVKFIGGEISVPFWKKRASMQILDLKEL